MYYTNLIGREIKTAICLRNHQVLLASEQVYFESKLFLLIGEKPINDPRL